ncbi:MAG: hydrolase, partial [Rhodospirillales bacterium]|nr:hydrolase [Rhodospirillales bacterium]
MTDHIKIGDIQPWAQVEQTVPGTVAFEFPFPIFEDADLEVYVDAALKTLATDYTVTGAGVDDGGAVTFAAAPPVGALVTLRRRLAVQRTSDFQETGEFRARVLNDELDYQTAALQQVATDLERSVRLAATAPSIALDFTPAAGRVLAVNAAGDGMTMGPSVAHIAEAGTNAAAAAVSAAAA